VYAASTARVAPRKSQSEAIRPRAGTAYALNEHTACAAGYGVFWAPPQGISADEFGRRPSATTRRRAIFATGGNSFVPCATVH